MRWFGARGCAAIAFALVTVASATLAAQELRYDSSVVAVHGSGPTTFVLISGMVGGVAGFRRLAAAWLILADRVGLARCCTLYTSIAPSWRTDRFAIAKRSFLVASAPLADGILSGELELALARGRPCLKIVAVREFLIELL